jgi:hypothetical protein
MVLVFIGYSAGASGDALINKNPVVARVEVG